MCCYRIHTHVNLMKFMSLVYDAEHEAERWDSGLPAHALHQGVVSRMSPQLTSQRSGAPCVVAIMKDTRF